MNEELEQAKKQKDKELHSLEGVLRDLEYKSSVASSECAKWTDNTLQVV